MKKFSKMVMIVLFVMIGAAIAESRGKLEMQEHIAQEIIRFHVRANSDSEADQQLKLQVKSAVVEYMRPILEKSSSIEESRQLLKDNTKEIYNAAKNVLAENNSDYEVSVYFEQSYFPMKSYGDITLPPGEYEAFRIDIGQAQGKNWWCVLYPPLCFIDATTGTLPESSKEQLKNVLTDEEYNAITGNTATYRFKYLTFLNDIFN